MQGLVPLFIRRLALTLVSLSVLAGLAALVPAGSASAAIAGFNNGAGWTANGAATFSANSLTLTHGNNGESASAFFNTKQTDGNFTADFDFNAVGGQADGFTFTIQNTSATAIGQGGSNLGYGGISPISPSVAVQTNFYAFNSGGVGIAENINGLLGDNGGNGYTLGGGVNLTSAPLHYHITYDGTTLTTLLTQGANTFSISRALDIPTIIGSGTAFVGFTGADGGLSSTQVVSNFTFGPGPTNGGGSGVPLPTAVWPAIGLLCLYPLVATRIRARLA
jgi:hypothetical protein